SGANPAGDHIKYRGCTFGTPSWGSAVSCMEMLGVNLSFIGNTFEARDNHLTDRGLIFIHFGASCVRPHGRFVFADNVVDLGPVSGNNVAAIAMVLQMTSSSGSVAVRQ